MINLRFWDNNDEYIVRTWVRTSNPVYSLLPQGRIWLTTQQHCFTNSLMVGDGSLSLNSELCSSNELRYMPTLIHLVQFSSVIQSCLTLCNPINCSMPGLPVHHYLPEFTQTHIHQVNDAIQPSHLLSSLFPPPPNPSQHQSLFQ